MNGFTPAGSVRSRTSLGLVLIGIGLFLALESAGILRTGGLARWWPLLLVGVGWVKVRLPREDGQHAAGVALLLFGGLFLLTSVLAFGTSWPLLLVGVGVFLLWQGIEGPRPPQGRLVSESPYLSDMALIGYLKRSQHGNGFRGGSVTAVMGGVELDLRKVSVADGRAFLDVVAFWGGIEIKVPTGWTVDGQVVPVMGAFENKVDPPAGSSGTTLVVRGHAIMGAVVIGH